MTRLLKRIGTYVDKQDSSHHPCKVVGEDLQERSKHALVVDNVPEQAVLLLLGLLGVLESFLDLLFLVEVRLCVDIIGEAHRLVTDDVIGSSHFDEQVRRVIIWVPIRMVLDAGLSEGFL